MNVALCNLMCHFDSANLGPSLYYQYEAYSTTTSSMMHDDPTSPDFPDLSHLTFLPSSFDLLSHLQHPIVFSIACTTVFLRWTLHRLN